MSNTNRVNRVFIGSGTNVGSGALPDVNVGDLFIYDSKNNLVDNSNVANLSAREEISIATAGGRKGNILFQKILGGKITKYEGKTYVAPSQLSFILGDPQVNGIEVTDGEEYRLRILFKDDQRVQGQRSTLFDANYPARTNVTQEDVAGYIYCICQQKEYNNNFIKDKVLVERVADGTFNALTNTATVVKGSKTVVSTVHGITGEAYLRFGANTSDAVYKAKRVDANTLELDYPYAGESDASIATESGTNSAKWGFKLTGLAQDSFINRSANEPLDEYEWINFDATFSEAEDRAVETVAPKVILSELNPGQGYWKQVADIEEKAKGYFGDTSKRRFDDNRISSNVDSGTNYDSIVITHVAEHIGDQQGLYNPPLKTEIYLPTGGSGQGDDTTPAEFLAILNAFTAKSGFAPIEF